jgi:hypothetical protein
MSEMTPRETDDPNVDPLERLLDRALRELPLRPAPPTLQSRVFGELERRASLPWWHRDFGRWPPLARAAFLVICGGLIELAFVGGSRVVEGVNSLSWARQAQVLLGSVGNLAALLLRSAPPAWLYIVIAACAVLYAVLFGLGAAVYRTLYLQPLNGR